ncbi:hypothetical protein Bravens_02035 [Brevibacterium ravenspurgense]|uniref:Zinc ribbon domain protein n=1 Tax=Brevibacterium ravenspurgense TaxID=479117 RepID=A0A150H5B9_9MICO|nr:hypothetical protein [Brevibacterium ravenspurgense]KXZ57205.1 hypothetical protein Bravens_02035 [Brevibacterium ravenspurgense]
MIVYDVKCGAGHRFEAMLKTMDSPTPDCTCGEPTRRMITRVNRGNAASAGRSRDEMPNTWRGIGNGNRDLVRGWHKEMRKREKLEEKYPELGGDRRPVIAHEGKFEASPVRAGDAGSDALARAAFGPAPSSDAATTAQISGGSR